MPVTFDQAYRAKAIRSGGWKNVPALPCPDLGGRVFWPDMPWHRPIGDLEVDTVRSRMLLELGFRIRCRTSFYDNVRSGTPYQLVDGVRATQVWPVSLFGGLGWRTPLPPVVARFGDPTGFLGDSQWLGVDLSGPNPVLWEAAALGVGWRGWQARKVTRSDTGRPFAESDAATASKIPMLALMPRPEEMLAGHIPRALAITGPASPRWHWPARFSDGLHPSLPIEYGDRLGLRPETAQRLRAKAPNIETVAIVNALEEYGGIYTDRTMTEIDAAGNTRLPMDPRINVQIADGDLSIADFRIYKTAA
jgi:hypothetical protein